jgi:hypothetical protein
MLLAIPVTATAFREEGRRRGVEFGRAIVSAIGRLPPIR